MWIKMSEISCPCIECEYAPDNGGACDNDCTDFTTWLKKNNYHDYVLYGNPTNEEVEDEE